MKKLLVIDGNSILNRAFYGVRLLSTKDGRFTNGIFGFMNIFLHLRNFSYFNNFSVLYGNVNDLTVKFYILNKFHKFSRITSQKNLMDFFHRATIKPLL